MASNVALTTGFLVTNKGLFFFDKRMEDIIPISLSNQIVEDLEIISEGSLQRVLTTWLEQFKLTPGPIGLILDASVYYETLVPQLPADNNDPQVQQFLETVPFTDLLLKSFLLQNGAIVLAVNQGFMQPLIGAIEKVGFSVLSVAPDFAFGLDTAKTPFSKEQLPEIFGRPQAALQYNLLSPAEVEAKLVTPKPFLSLQIDIKTIAMIVIFVVLLGVLGVLLMLQK